MGLQRVGAVLGRNSRGHFWSVMSGYDDVEIGRVGKDGRGGDEEFV